MNRRGALIHRWSGRFTGADIFAPLDVSVRRINVSSLEDEKVKNKKDVANHGVKSMVV